MELRRVEFVSPQVGKELTERGGLAMVIALLLIFVYVMVRFQWKFATGAVAALARDRHDQGAGNDRQAEEAGKGVDDDHRTNILCR